MTFTSDSRHLYVADKTGDCFEFDCEHLETPGKWILGHLSMVLDVLVTPDNRFTDKYSIFAGEGSEHEICKFNSRLIFLKAKLSTVFPDVLNRATRYLVLKGDWRDKKCIIYLGEPKHGGVPIARIYRPLSGRSFLGVDDYFIEIAAGIDDLIIELYKDINEFFYLNLLHALNMKPNSLLHLRNT